MNTEPSFEKFVGENESKRCHRQTRTHGGERGGRNEHSVRAHRQITKAQVTEAADKGRWTAHF